jgi:hypothetical protein
VEIKWNFWSLNPKPLNLQSMTIPLNTSMLKLYLIPNYS